MNSFDKKASFHLPGLFKFPQIYTALLQLYTQRRFMFKDNMEISSIYGSPTAIWNGGRFVDDIFLNHAQLTQVKQAMEFYKIPARFTFTNCLLEEKHVHDAYCNEILKIFNTGNNEIICNSEILENYIRKEYGDRYKYISSTTKRITDKEQQKIEVDKNYYLVVLDYDFNKDIEYLQSIPHKEKCELLVNPVCKAKCPFRTEHYRAISEAQLEFNVAKMMQCKFVGRDALWQSMKEGNFISVEDINNIYLPMGFTNFKLEGRKAHPLDLIEVLVYYLAKDEYRDELRSYLQESIW